MFKKYGIYLLTFTILGSFALFTANVGAKDTKINAIGLIDRTLEDELADIERYEQGDKGAIVVPSIPMIPPLEEYADEGRWDEKLMPSYKVIVEKDTDNVLESHFVNIRSFSKDAVLQSLVGENISISELKHPEIKDASPPETYLYAAIPLSSLKYSGDRGNVYISVVEVIGLSPDQPVILGAESLQIEGREVWLGVESGLYLLNQASFVCGNKVVGVVGEQSVEQLASLTSSLVIDAEIGCDLP